VGDSAMVLNPGAPSRVGERVAVREALERFKKVTEMAAPATLDGGDILFADDQYFVGLTERTNRGGFEVFERFVREKLYKATAVPMTNILHLKSACTYLGDSRILAASGYFDESIFCNYTLIHVSKIEEYSANCVAVNDKVIVIAGYPQTKAAIEAAGFETIEVEMSEFKKGGGSLTCLSIIF
jgi:dimethylargininase